VAPGIARAPRMDEGMTAQGDRIFHHVTIQPYVAARPLTAFARALTVMRPVASAGRRAQPCLEPLDLVRCHRRDGWAKAPKLFSWFV
jgi:hypothetical protein